MKKKSSEPTKHEVVDSIVLYAPQDISTTVYYSKKLPKKLQVVDLSVGVTVIRCRGCWMLSSRTLPHPRYQLPAARLRSNVQSDFSDLAKGEDQSLGVCGNLRWWWANKVTVSSVLIVVRCKLSLTPTFFHCAMFRGKHLDPCAPVGC